ncbi:hypothetical protein HMPREF0105_4200 [Bacteroides sp. 3_1_33FAA]|nr:hypothetical protein HMPREF0105_4200 [Bacteroides sp. 3_1_33FAA]
MDPNGKKEGRHEGLPFLRYNTYKDYHLMIFQALPPRILPAVFSLSDLQSKC